MHCSLACWLVQLCRGFDPAQPKAPVKLTNISSHVLERILEYCRFHTATGDTDHVVISGPLTPAALVYRTLSQGEPGL